jgi:flagellar hook-length control protein FliK
MVDIRDEYQGMSSAPLPPMQAVTPKIATPSPSPQRSDSAGGANAFGTHLHDAQRQQTSADDTQPSAKTADSASDASKQGNQASDASSGATATNASSASVLASSLSSSADTTQANASDSDSDDSLSLTSLASSVLSLIDQAAGDVSGEGNAASAPKAASEKSSAQTKGNGQTAQASPATPVIALPPPPVPQAVAANKSSAAADVVQTTANATTAPLSALSAQKPGGSAVANGFSDDDDDAVADSTTASGGNASAQATPDATQSLAASAMTATHAAFAAVNGASSSAPTQNAPDFASLRGALDATAITAQPVATASATHSLSGNAPVGSSGFAKELGQQVTWLSGQEVKQAQIKLNPENLGPLDVKVSVEHGRVDVAFMTQHPETTAAVQQSLDQLNQMLGGHGLSLGHTSVGQHSQSQQFGESSQQASSQASNATDNAEEDTGTSVLQRVAVGLVDAFA